MANNEFDVIIIGGGIIGTATGYYLAKAGQKILLLEKKYLGSGSTGRCIGGIRAQFSTDATIRVGMESVELFQNMEKEFGFSVEWKPSGYLFLAYTKAQQQSFLNVISLQNSYGLDVQYLTTEEIQKKFPYINNSQSLGGTWCPTDGQADPFFVLKGYMLGIKKMGGTILCGQEVVGIDSRGSNKFEVVGKTGQKFYSEKILNAAGPDARELGKMVGLDLPVAPERHEALITEAVEYIGIPMMVDYRPDGCYFQQRLTGQIIGCYTPEERFSGKQTDSTFEFLTEMSRRMIRLIPSIENVTVLRQWGGSYTMTPDGNPIVDKTSVPGYYVSVAMCGHGFMLGPSLGKNMADFMTGQQWAFDMSEFSFYRSFGKRAEALK